MKRTHWIIVAVLLFIIALLTAVLLHDRLADTPSPLGIDSSAVSWEGRQLLQQSFNGTGGIAIPGFGLQYFAADKTTQQVNFYNPTANDCLFKMTLIVKDTVFWQSGNIAPGKGYYEIELSDPIPVGEYTANLRIECLTPEGQPLNGATVEFDLIVQ